jgi:hypothetical protein
MKFPNPRERWKIAALLPAGELAQSIKEKERRAILIRKETF